MKTQRFLFITILVLISGQAWGQCPKDKLITIQPFDQNIYPTTYKKGSTIKFAINNVNIFKVKGSEVKKDSANYTFGKAPVLIAERVALIDGTAEKVDKASQSKDREGETAIGQIEASKTHFEEAYCSFLNTLWKIEKAINLKNELVELIGDGVFIENVSALQESAEYLYDAAYKPETSIEALITNLHLHYIQLLKVDDRNEDTNLHKPWGMLKPLGPTTLQKQAEDSFKEAIDYAKKTMAVFNNPSEKKIMLEKAESGVLMYHKIVSSKFIHYTNAIQLNDDFVTLTPKLRDGENKVIYEFEPFTIKTQAGIRVNFSTGYLLSFKGDEEYDYSRDTTGAIVGVKDLGGRTFTHGLGALAHVFWDCKGNKQLGISSGISLNNDAKVNFHLGGSLGFIENNRLIFTAGVSLVNLKKLNRSSLDENNEFISSKHTEINYIDRYEPAFFFGITYNLVNKK